MVVYNFKKIQPVPTNKDFVDIVLTRTQRKTPTVIRANFHIARIREFYMRKVRFTQDTFHEKFAAILAEFPKLDDIHPFYADLINVLYDRDHYKLALGQVNTAKSIIDNISKDYLRLLKYGDSLFRCKQLKRAALGRMCTVLRKQGPTLEYLEEVRKHLARLPSIDPSTRTLLVCGYPNVGKSSFMNKVTRADVEVQPYAFTTKSLFVGHCDYKYARWQVIDTPGILDHPLEDRNTIEMQSITALAHLQCSIMYFIDISETCGYTIAQQVSLFENIAPLFVNKPIIVTATKIDAQPWETLDPVDKAKIEAMVAKAGAIFRTMSNMTEVGVMEVRNTACDALLERRLEAKMRANKKVGDIVNRLTITQPKPRDNRSRELAIPPSVAAARAVKAAADAAKAAVIARASASMVDEDDRDGEDEDEEEEDSDLISGSASGKEMVRKWLERDREKAAGGPGVYRPDLTRHYILKEDEWRTDMVPEIMDGKNVADFVDPDIMEKLIALEAEEEAAVAAEEAAMEVEPTAEEKEEAAATKSLLKVIRGKKKIIVASHREEQDKNHAVLPRRRLGINPAAARAHLTGLGLPAEAAESMLASASGAHAGQKRGRSLTRRGRDEDAGDEDDEMGMEDGRPSSSAAAGAGAVSAFAHKRARSSSRHRALSSGAGVHTAAQEARLARDKSRERAHSVVPQRDGLSNPIAKRKVTKLAKKQQNFDFRGTQGESDRHIGVKLPRWLNSGKRGIGKTDRR